MKFNSDPAFDTYLNEIKRASLEQRRGELEVRLGEARLMGDADCVRELRAELADVEAEIAPTSRLEFPYPAPLAEAAFYGLSGDIVNAILPHTEADPVAILMNINTFFGNCVGNGPHIKVGADKHPPRIYPVMVGVSGKGRKGSSVSPVKELFKTLEPDWAENKIQTGLSSGEGLIWAVRDAIYKTQPVKEKGRVVDYEEVMIDAGIGDKRLLVVEEEFSRTLKVMARDGNVLSPVIRQAWDTGNLQVLTKNTPARSNEAHISIIGHSTSEELNRYLNEVELCNGFANRFIWLCVKRARCLPFGGEFHISDLNPILTRLKRAIEFSSSAGEITWSTETTTYWTEIYDELSEGKPGISGALLARAEAQVIRIALIYALFDCSREIRRPHLKAALAIWGYIEESVRYIFRDSTGDSLAEKIHAELCKNPEGMTRTEINNFLGRNCKADRIDEALNKLRGAKMVATEKVETGGRPTERWIAMNNGTKKHENTK